MKRTRRRKRVKQTHTKKKQLSTDNCAIHRLDVYSLSVIFSYLEPRDLINTAQVCHKWEPISHRAWKNVSKKKFNDFLSKQKTADDVRKIFPFLKYVSHIDIGSGEFFLVPDKEQFFNEFFEVLSKSKTNCLRSLKWDFHVSQNLVRKILSANIHNLEVIDITPGNRVRISAEDIKTWLKKAVNLKEFNWHIIAENQQKLLLPLMKSLPKTLKIFRLSISVNIAKPISVELLFKHLNQMSKLDVLLLSGLNFKLKNNTPFYTTARRICFVRRRIGAADFGCFPINPKLRYLALEGGFLTDENVEFITKNYSSLTSIQLVNVETTDQVIGRFSELDKLNKLSLTGVHNWTGSTLKSVSDLKELQIRYCDAFKESFLFHWLYKAKNLKCLCVDRSFRCSTLVKHWLKSSSVRNHYVNLIIGNSEN